MPEVAALIAVPLPLRTPVTEVARVRAGVAPPDEEPVKPFAEATETAVTEPEPAADQDATVPFVVKNNPEFPVCDGSSALIAFAADVWPVPPFAIGTAEPFHTPDVIVPT